MTDCQTVEPGICINNKILAVSPFTHNCFAAHLTILERNRAYPLHGNFIYEAP